MKALETLWTWLQERLLWIVVTDIGWATSLVMAALIAQIAGLILPQEVGLAMGGLAGGALIGFVQWLYLRPEIRGIGFWALATAIGWTLGLVVTTLVAMVTSSVPGWIIGGILGGLAFGLAQWLALHPGTKTRVRWMLMTTITWAVAVNIVPGNANLGTLTDEITQVALNGVVGMTLIGAVVAATLVLAFPKFWKRGTIIHHLTMNPRDK